MDNNNTDNSAERWVGYRKELKIMDCTIRDGGLMNDSNFDDKTVRAVLDANEQAGIDYMEIGYKNSTNLFAPDKYGAWRFCKEDDLKRVVEDRKLNVKLCAMADAQKSDYKTDILPKKDSPLDMIRVAAYIHQLPLAIDMVKDAVDKGYETTVNIMSISNTRESDLMEALEMVGKCPTNAIYIVDSFGSLYSEQISSLVKMYSSIAKQTGKTVGIHAHNNLQLGFANTIQAIVDGANMIDATFAGLGRGAGNCPMELLLGFLHNPKYQIRPVLQCIRDYIEPMRKDVLWGFDHNYMMTGFLNRHPRSAIAFNERPDKGADILAFYDKILTES